MAEKLSKENDLQKKAFEMYYDMGEKRSLKAVAKLVERTERTVAGWSREFNWVARVAQRNIEVHKTEKYDEINTQLTDVRTRYRIIINNFMAKLSEKVLKGEVAVRNISDFEKLVKLDLLLMGEATDRQELMGTQELSQEDKDRLDQIAKLMSSM